MGYSALLFFGFLIGIQHAVEADHLAAVAALSAKHTSRRALVLRGSVWGIGHSITLLAISGALLLLDETIAPRTEAMLELAVGIMVVLLGSNVLYRLWRQRPHIHAHRHDDAGVHLHFHSHALDTAPHADSEHGHSHCDLGLGRALLVGMMHGAAGSAGLLVLAAAARSVVEAMGYVAAFGIGSIIGMAVLSFTASFPLRLLETYAKGSCTFVFACIGAVAVLVGGGLIAASWALL